MGSGQSDQRDQAGNGAPSHHFIYSYRRGEQQHWEASWDRPGRPSEEELIRFALRGFTAEEARDLRKLSVCQIGGAIPEWLRASGGKYFFDADGDAAEKRWAAVALSVSAGPGGQDASAASAAPF